MAEEAPRRGGGVLQKLFLSLIILGLLAAVWWLASERNQRHFRVSARQGVLLVERGRFFPLGMVAVGDADKVYAPVTVPQGEKGPAEMEFEDQNSLDRWLFDLFSGWANAAGKRGDTKTAGLLVERASRLPGLSGEQVAQLASLRADLAWEDAQADLTNAAQLLDAARRKLEQVRQNNGAHSPDAAQLQNRVSDVQKVLQDLTKR
jgi:hypothetical protein